MQFAKTTHSSDAWRVCGELSCVDTNQLMVLLLVKS